MALNLSQIYERLKTEGYDAEIRILPKQKRIDVTLYTDRLSNDPADKKYAFSISEEAITRRRIENPMEYMIDKHISYFKTQLAEPPQPLEIESVVLIHSPFTGTNAHYQSIQLDIKHLKGRLKNIPVRARAGGNEIGVAEVSVKGCQLIAKIKIDGTHSDYIRNFVETGKCFPNFGIRLDDIPAKNSTHHKFEVADIWFDISSIDPTIPPIKL